MASLRQDVEQVTTDIDRLAADLGIITATGKDFLRVVLANAKLMDRKQQDYGSRNISKFGVFGTLVRISDKVERLCNLYTVKGKRKRVNNESILDSYRDLANYATIACMLELDLWPTQ